MYEMDILTRENICQKASDILFLNSLIKLLNLFFISSMSLMRWSLRRWIFWQIHTLSGRTIMRAFHDKTDRCLEILFVSI